LTVQHNTHSLRYTVVPEVRVRGWAQLHGGWGSPWLATLHREPELLHVCAE